MWSFRLPTPQQRLAFRLAQGRLDYTYPHVGCTATETPPPGFVIDSYGCELGQGESAFDSAKQALREWKQFPTGWIQVDPLGAPIAVGSVISIAARVCGIWWLNACRIVYCIDEPARFGFAYVTLPGHAEAGEERFLIEREPDGQVMYRVLAYSRPRHWAARLAYPLARRVQHRFRRDTLRAMQVEQAQFSGHD